MIYANRQDDKITFQAPFQYKDLLRSIPGCRWNAQQKLWRAPLSIATARAARSMLGAQMVLSDALLDWGVKEISRIERVADAKKIARPGINPSLYAFQQQGVSFLVAAERAILADEMGLGKSAQAIHAIHELGAYPCLIICTNSMKYTWKEEIEKWMSVAEPGVIVLDGSLSRKRKMLAEGGPIYVVNWEAIRTLSRLSAYGSIHLSEKEREPKELNSIPWMSVILDESHKMKDPHAKQTRAAWSIAHSVPIRYALTGTPVANTPEDVWSIGHAIAPEEYPSKTQFIDRYTRNSLNIWGGLDVAGLKPETKDEFFSFFDPRFLRRTKAEVLPQLPEKTYSVRYVEMSRGQDKVYRELERDFATLLDSGEIIVTENIISNVLRLRQAASATLSVDSTGVQLQPPSCKLDGLLDIIGEAPTEPLVVFSSSRKLLNICAGKLEAEHKSFEFIVGGQTAKERAASVDTFQRGDSQILLATVSAGGEGLTLTAASRLLFLDRPWSSVQSIQAEDRIHRIGQTGNVEIIDLITLDSIESRVHEVLADKAEKMQEITRDPRRVL